MFVCPWCVIRRIPFEKFQKILKTTEYLRVMGFFDSIKLRMLRRADYARERKFLKASHVHSYKMEAVHNLGWGIGWAHSLLSLKFVTGWYQKHLSYVSSKLFLKFHLAALLRRVDYMRCLKLLTSSVMF